MFKYSLSLCLLLVLVPLFFMAEAQAATCSLTTPNIAFNAYNPFDSSDSQIMTNLQVTCNGKVNVTMLIDKGQNSANFSPRYMKNASTGELMSYNLFKTSYNSGIIFGDGTSPTQTLLQLCPRNQAANYPVYGVIPNGQDVGTGSYSDTLRVTITW